MARSVFRAVLTLLVLGAALASARAAAAQTPPPPLPAAVRSLVRTHCLDCHSGPKPAAGLNLEPASLPAAVLDRPSGAKPELKIVDTAAPGNSYLLMKVRGAAGIAGSRMPLRAAPLKDGDIRILAEWLDGLKKPGAPAADAEAKKKPERPAFQGLTLANLPTDRLIERGHFLFRVAHRFFPAVDSGAGSFFGLDGPGAVLLGFGYGLSDRLAVSLGRTNQFQEWDVAFHYRALGADADHPFGLTVHAGAALTTAALPDRSVVSSRNFRTHLELTFSGRLTDRVSLLAVPAFVTNPDQRQPGRGGTFALGLGGRWLVLEDISLFAEWIPVLAGWSAGRNGWALGLEKKIGGHVFQFFVLNAVGSTPAQYLPGPDLRDQDARMRIGFNITRLF